MHNGPVINLSSLVLSFCQVICYFLTINLTTQYLPGFFCFFVFFGHRKAKFSQKSNSDQASHKINKNLGRYLNADISSITLVNFCIFSGKSAYLLYLLFCLQPVYFFLLQTPALLIGTNINIFVLIFHNANFLGNSPTVRKVINSAMIFHSQNDHPQNLKPCLFSI